MRHTNIPGNNAVEGSYSGPDASPGPSRPPPPNSMRALMSKSQQRNNKPSCSSVMSSPNSSGSSSRHTYTTRYGTQENIYEEIGSDERLRMMMMNGSMISLDQSMVQEEFRRVQNRHRRILGELNLSVEAMIMPSTPPNDSPNDDEEDDQLGDGAKGSSVKKQQRKNEFKMQTIVHPMSHERLSGNCGASGMDGNDSGAGCSGTNNNGDLDSGFSGSSSGASYVGSLRYHRNSSGLSNCCPGNNLVSEPHNNGPICEESCRSFQRAQEDPGMSFSTRSWSSYSSSKSQNNQQMADPFQYQRHGQMHRSAEDPGPRRADIINMNCNNMCSDNSSTNNSIDSKSLSKSSFWSMKGWRKFSRFSSTNSVNKAGCINF